MAERESGFFLFVEGRKERGEEFAFLWGEAPHTACLLPFKMGGFQFKVSSLTASGLNV